MAFHRDTPLQERIPAVEIPSLEVLGVQAWDYSQLFPERLPEYAPAEFGNYYGPDPRPGTPLHPLLRNLNALRTRTNRQKDTAQLPQEEADRVLAYTSLQKKMLSTISHAYTNSVNADLHPLDATSRIDGFIEERDTEVFMDLSAKIRQKQVELASPAPNITPYMRGKVYASDEERIKVFGGVEDTYPASKEIEVEAHRRVTSEELTKYQLRLQKLRFEWLSATVMIDALRENVRADKAVVIDLSDVTKQQKAETI